MTQPTGGALVAQLKAAAEAQRAVQEAAQNEAKLVREDRAAAEPEPGPTNGPQPEPQK